MIFACVKSGTVVNTIVASQAFIDAATDIVAQYDSIVRVDALSPTPGVGWSYNGTTFADNRSSPPTNAAVVNVALANAREFGTALIEQFATQNVLAGVTQAGMTQTIGLALHDMYHFLITGSLYAAIAECDQLAANILIATWSPFITPAILTSYKNQIQTYLGVPLT